MKNLKISKGAAQPNLSTKQINKIEIPLPPTSVQQCIVNKLDTMFVEIDKTTDLYNKQLSNYMALKSAILAKELQCEESMNEAETRAELIDKQLEAVGWITKC